ncbi:MAG: helix-turn-helix domain-containing protein [Anaerolineae bacterium]
MQTLNHLLKSRLDRVTRPDPTITIHRGEDFYITNTGVQERQKRTYVKFSVSFREQQLMQLKGPPLAIFICLALHIEEDGTCFPSVGLISKETGYNRDTVFESLKKLEFMGYIARRQKIDPSSKKFKSNVYQLFPKAIDPEARTRVGNEPSRLPPDAVSSDTKKKNQV